MRFQKDLYHYQLDILNVFEKELKRGDKKIHIVAPPGSGKTIVWLEMVTRLDVPTLILVPNLTLQEQWRDKLATLFLEAWENLDELVSTSPDSIKRINIITYQSLTQTQNETDGTMVRILKRWYGDFRDEFPSLEVFTEFTVSLRESDEAEYRDNIRRYKKLLKISGSKKTIHELLSERVMAYFASLKSYGIQALVVDEAHHLTAWWSKVMFSLYEFLGNAFIIGLTATPPFDNVDFFDLDDSYADLLGEVDYYIPTPAIVKSGKLAPYSDLVYFVKPDANLRKILKDKESILREFLKTHGAKIGEYLYETVRKDFEKLQAKNMDILNGYLRFIHAYRPESDITEYVSEYTFVKINLEDIAKCVGKWLMAAKMDTDANTELSERKGLFPSAQKMFFDLGYIWRAKNFYKFQTPIEKLLIYSKTKIDGIVAILKKERENLGENLRAAIITDFLSAESDFINCEYIFDTLIGEFSDLDPYLVSGQGIWKIGADGKRVPVLTETILSVTRKLASGETKLVIGTRGILGEWWDCPKLNTLIDLTGITTYMSVNQVRGRAIRLDLENPQKTANIYDVVCIGEWLQWSKDLLRLEKKHEKFYGVNDAGIIVKGVDHVYPNLLSHLENPEGMNRIMLRRSEFRSAVYDNWGIGQSYSNKEIFGLHLEIREFFTHFPLVKTSIFSIPAISRMFKKDTILKDIKDSYYFQIVFSFLKTFVEAVSASLQSNGVLPEDFKYRIHTDENGNMQIVSEYRDELVSKGFITYLSEIFSPVTTQKYLLSFPMIRLENQKLDYGNMTLGLPDALSKKLEFRENFRDALVPWEKRKEKWSNWEKIRAFGSGAFVGLVQIVFGTLLFMAGVYVFLLVIDLISSSPIPGELWILITAISAWAIMFLVPYIKPVSKLIWEKLQKKFISFHFYTLSLKKNRRKEVDFIYLNSPETDKKSFIGKTPFIASKIEKLWI